ncbi:MULTISPECIES: ABC transporter ATP-binding protein [unclassified Mesorhizobium]|uniref:ABC transporter ATP-binding protein n=1 Tax=unclassified Mesorhizobium TaxID=325217 RepID=UPI000FDB3888|nr:MULTISPECIES: ABC transporter ATP-binding protein [unclassified Mesorhizobium]TGT65572.1 ABC transporter ATP-binding protein [Mesorhizobium sp. M2E.F.Ca.ET.166.01.1.1]TGV97619.1 ABC transporter ATP-binding protein [Mesorhizobium sp. M2E.F.Ca.ET.154.01.1.1]
MMMGIGKIKAGCAVAIRELTKEYYPIVAVAPTSVDVASGGFFAIIGPSGSGKSTLLGILAGYVQPTAGRVEVNGKDILSEPMYRRNIGMVFQNYALFPHMTVAENIAFPLKMRGLQKSEVTERVRHSLAMVRLEQYRDRKPGMLSGGQQQRVALARAAIYQPSLLLMDEPLGALDKNLRDEMQEEIKRFQQELGITVIYVTHDQQEAAFLADRIGIMKDGAMVQIGTPRELYERPTSRFVAGFLGEASVFAITGLSAGSEASATIEGGLSMRINPANAARGGKYVCIRPENVMIGQEAARLPNVYEGVITESLYTAGSVRYRITAPAGQSLVSRALPHTGFQLYETGRTVKFGWSPDDVCVIN